METDLDLIAKAESMIDLEPEGGWGSGKVVAKGTPERVASVKRGPNTAGMLRGVWGGGVVG